MPMTQMPEGAHDPDDAQLKEALLKYAPITNEHLKAAADQLEERELLNELNRTGGLPGFGNYGFDDEELSAYGLKYPGSKKHPGHFNYDDLQKPLWDDSYDHHQSSSWWDVPRLAAYLLLAFIIISFINVHWDSVKAFWRRRKAAARYKRAKKDDTGGDDHESAGMELAVEDEPSFYETLTATFTGDKRVECTVDLGSGGKTHTIDAFISTLEKVSELPFLLQESCKRSGVGELAALSLVDLWIHERARIQLTEPSGMQREVGRGITPTMCLRATAFRVTILPQQTR